LIGYNLADQKNEYSGSKYILNNPFCIHIIMYKSMEETFEETVEEEVDMVQEEIGNINKEDKLYI